MSLRDPKLMILDMLEAVEKALSYTEDMLEAVEKALSYTEGMAFEDFLKDSKTQDAVTRNIQIIGEAANRIPKDFQELKPEIEWLRITRSRHILVHDYFATDFEIIWRILEVHLPELQQQLKDFLKVLP
jgi:uncharacterized protein with HEPN domain